MKLNQLALFADTPIETPLAAIEKQLDVYRKRAVSDGYRARCLPAWLQKQSDSVKRACWHNVTQPLYGWSAGRKRCSYEQTNHNVKPLTSGYPFR